MVYLPIKNESTIKRYVRVVDIIEGCINGNLKDVKVDWYRNAAICVVMASRGY